MEGDLNRRRSKSETSEAFTEELSGKMSGSVTTESDLMMNPSENFYSFRSSYVSTTDLMAAEEEEGADGGDVRQKWRSKSMKPHKANNDAGWEAIRKVEEEEGRELRLDDFHVLEELGSGDMGTVYLVQLRGNESSLFALKVMDKIKIYKRNKQARSVTERRILSMLDHPFLPTLYGCFESNRSLYLLIDFCPGGDLHYARQMQPARRFNDGAVRFYVSEVVLALEYLHMMGIVYRDLKPENVLIRKDGHIMLTDFDLSLVSHTQPSLQTTFSSPNRVKSARGLRPSASSTPLPRFMPTPDMFFPSRSTPATASKDHVSCLPAFPLFRRRSRRSSRCGEGVSSSNSEAEAFGNSGRKGTTGSRRKKRGVHVSFRLEIVAEPVDARSESFVGTHEYLAPEVIKNDGHGNAVDWWTLGIFMYELLYGITPFRAIESSTSKSSSNVDAAAASAVVMDNILHNPLKFPDEEPMDDGTMILPPASSVAKDLIRRLLNKDPAGRLGYSRGSADIKRHPFFKGVSWHLIRNSGLPPVIPQPYHPATPSPSISDDVDDQRFSAY